MHESVRQPRSVALTTPDGDDDEYDVYYFYPSLNRANELASQFTPFDASLDDNTPSYVSVLSFPSYSFNSDFVFPDPHVSVHDISTLGYSALFRRGLWAQSRCVSRRLNAFITRIKEACCSLKNRFRRHRRRTPPVA
ncbi:hypothetical protein GSI_00551 [Ganoderma sinense ZZ0214-1]|uniref:Uncharacterized protein n=1 Tax=Ganoderma sinense ZZ0214-1 TaxID=1077348 RepID=A0A2G8SSU8_9APHY|nr:hypothetical protein GSI_00551 [Ganoderma sinense ZZ0214-1]